MGGPTHRMFGTLKDRLVCRARRISGGRRDCHFKSRGAFGEAWARFKNSLMSNRNLNHLRSAHAVLGDEL
jgi:hypothetical protein